MPIPSGRRVPGDEAYFEPNQGLGDPRHGTDDGAFMAGARGLAETGSAGLIGPLMAAGEATARLGRGDTWIDRFRDILAEQRAQDQADLAYHPLARRVGQGAGLFAGLIAPEALGAKTFASTAAPGLDAAAGRISESGIGHVARVGAATGAASNVVGQGVSDAINGRMSSPWNYAAAAGAGALGGVAGMYGGAPVGGAVVGGATPAFQAVLAGRVPSLDDVISGAASSAVLARGFGGAAAGWSDGLDRLAKGRWGDNLSVADAWLRRSSGAKNTQKEQLNTSIYQPGGAGQREKGFTIPDVTADPWSGGQRQYVEAKFGPYAKLERAQPFAASELPRSTYLPQHWLSRDVGNFAGVGAGGLLGPRRHP